MRVLMAVAFAIALLFCLFLYMALGMAVGSFQANMFLVSVLALAAIVYGAMRWVRRSQKNEP